MTDFNCPSFSDDDVLYKQLCQDYVGLTGEKISIDQLIDKEIVFKDFILTKGKYYNENDCMKIQVMFDGRERVFFTQSAYIMKTLLLYKEKLPRKGTITRQNRAYMLK